MKNKRIITLLIAGALVAGSLAGCSAQTSQTAGTTQENTTASTTAATTQAEVVEESTEAATEVVTDKDGKPVTEVVTDKNGEKVTDKNNKEVTKVVTKKSTSTTKKASNKKTTTEKSGDGSAQGDAQSSTAAPQPVSIVLKKNRQAECTSPNVSMATGEVYIEKGGDYVITTETDDWHGQIIVKLANTESCELRFEGKGKISNDSNNIIQIIDSNIKSDRTFLEAEQAAGTDADDAIKEISENDKAPDVDIAFPTGSDWTIQGSGNSYTGIIYNESKLTIKGNGKANIAAIKNNNCICSTKSVSIKNVALTLTTANNTVTESFAKGAGSAKGIFSYSRVNVESGTLNIKSNGDAIRCDELNIKGGSVTLSSSACDGVDADDLILISGGTVKCTALQKHSFKVRRVNNAEKAHDQKAAGKAVTVSEKSRVRAGKGDGFYINGGTVVGESAKISSLDSAYQSDKKDSTQANITCKVVKENKGSTEESKVPSIIKIGTINKASANKCIKFLYSSSSVKKGTAYKVSVSNDKTAEVKWNGSFGCAEIASATNK